jgi:uncharacterized membrane protein
MSSEEETPQDTAPADDEDVDYDKLENGKSGNAFTRAIKAPFNLVGKVFETALTVLSAGATGIFDIILYILKIIWSFLILLFTKIIPFIVMYIGVPAFILGIIMGLFFLGGHILLVIVFIVGIIYYIKNLVSIVYKLPDNTKENQGK